MEQDEVAIFVTWKCSNRCQCTKDDTTVNAYHSISGDILLEILALDQVLNLERVHDV